MTTPHINCLCYICTCPVARNAFDEVLLKINEEIKNKTPKNSITIYQLKKRLAIIYYKGCINTTNPNCRCYTETKNIYEKPIILLGDNEESHRQFFKDPLNFHYYCCNKCCCIECNSFFNEPKNLIPIRDIKYYKKCDHFNRIMPISD